MIKAQRKIFKVSEIVPADYNPRKINKKSLKGLTKSLDKFGYLQDIIVNIRDQKNRIVGGHQRLTALGLPPDEEIECTIVDLSEMQEKALNIALNNKHTSGEYTEGLEDILADLSANFEDFNELNFDDLASEFDFNFDDEPPGDGDDVPDVVEDPVIKLGDLIEMGGHRLLCGDSTKKEDVEKLMDGEEPNTMVTDPPYGVNLDQSWRDKALGNKALGKGNASIVENDDRADWFEVWDLFKGDIAYVWHASSFTDVVMDSLRRANFEIKQQIIWNKSIMVMGRSDYHFKHEPCWYAVRKNKTHNWLGDRKQTTIWDAAPPNHIMGGSKEDKTDHPTQKPILLYEKAFLNHTNKGEYIYEPFGGSGTSIICAEKLNRRSLTMELDEKYCQVIIQRWCDYTEKTEIKINGEEVNWTEYKK